MSGDARAPGRLSLRLDSVYCAVAAALLLGFAGPVSERLAVPPPAAVALAAGVGAWAFGLHHIARRPRLRPWLRSVLLINTVAAVLIATFAGVRPWDGVATVLLLAVAAEVAAFAVSQAAALRRTAPAP